jgi:hypothetical protein
MLRTVRLMLVWVMALSLVASAAAWTPCTAMQLAAAGIASSGHPADHHASADGHAMHDHHATPEDTPASTPTGDPVCTTCCAMCMLANATLPAATGAALFTISSAAFFRAAESWAASIIAVDPGIPKPVA